MLGILYAIGSLFGYTAGGIQASYQDAECKARGLQRQKDGTDLTGIYYDRLGRSRDLKTNKLVSIKQFDPKAFVPVFDAQLHHCVDGDKIVVRDADNVVIRNISHLEREKKFQDEKDFQRKQGKTVVLYDTKCLSINGHYVDGINGYRYKDIENGDVYVCRNLLIGFWHGKSSISPYTKHEYYCRFYMNKHGYLVRIADSQYQKWEEEKKDRRIVSCTEKMANDFIEHFNKLQDEGGWVEKTYEEHRQGKNEYTLKDLQYVDLNYYDYACDNYYCNKFSVIDR